MQVGASDLQQQKYFEDNEGYDLWNLHGRKPVLKEFLSSHSKSMLVVEWQHLERVDKRMQVKGKFFFHEDRTS